MKKGLIILLMLLGCLAADAQKGVLLQASGDLIKEGNELYDKRKFREAVSKYEQVSRNDTNYAWAVFETALTYQQMENYSKAVEVLLKGLTLDCDREHNFYHMLGNNYNLMDSTALSLKYLEEGIAKYPNHYLLYFYKGMTLLSLKKDKEAFEAFKKAIEINYYHVGSHLQMGNLAYKYGMVAPALMSYTFALMFEPNSKRAMEAIGNMVKLMKVEDMTPEDRSKFMNYQPGNNDLEDIDQIIASKVALDSKYKSKSKIDDRIINQLQILCEKLVEKGDDKGFWMENYGWFYKKIYEQNQFAGMTYLIFSGVGSDDVQKVIKSNAKKLNSFKTFAITEVAAFRSAKPFTFKGQTYKMTRYFNDNGTMEAMGETNPKTGKQTGKWLLFGGNGNVTVELELDDAGERAGTWYWYYDNNQIKEEATYVNGKLNGPNKEYTRDGVMTLNAKYKDGKSEGDYYSYYSTGQLEEHSIYKDGERNGMAKVYFRNGSRKYEVMYKDGEKTHYRAYFNNDSLYEVYAMNDGKAVGDYISYYNNGQVQSKGKYTDDKADGPWVYYFRNGNKKYEGTYATGKAVGVWNYYHTNGAFEHKEEYDEDGKTKGWIKMFDVDSVLHFEYFYEKGKIRKYTFYDKAGKVLSTGQEKGGKLFLKGYYPEGGVVEMEGTLDDGERDGTWKFYDRSGALTSKAEYKDGTQEGLSETFFANGKIKTRCTLKDGDYDGYYTRYFTNGKVDREGWYVEDNMQGDWFYYHLNGNVESITSYLNDDITGHEEYYNENGQLQSDYYWDDIHTNRITSYDTLGNVVADNKLNHGNGPYKFLYSDGKLKVAGQYRNGQQDSVRTGYYHSGKIRFRDQFVCGRRVGKYVFYWENGKISLEGNYFWDNKEGEWKDYDENGKLEEVATWRNGELEGPTTWYYDNGKIEVQGIYHEGNREGWFTYYEPGGMVRFKVRYIEGVAQAYSYLDKDGKYVPEISLNHGNGTLKAYFQNGAVSAELEYKNGWLLGTRKLYFPNGNIHKEEPYTDGDLDGVWKEYYPSGKIKASVNYYMDCFNGAAVWYFENGKVEKEANYILDTMHGVRTKYDMTGKVVERKVFVYGEEIK